MLHFGCCWYHKGTNFQANHNIDWLPRSRLFVVADTTKVRIFKQITTNSGSLTGGVLLLLIPQRYEFSSKSQPGALGQAASSGCCWYHKGTNFQANHNTLVNDNKPVELLLIPQRYEFSSKSQPAGTGQALGSRCCWYHKGTNFQANHN